MRLATFVLCSDVLPHRFPVPHTKQALVADFVCWGLTNPLDCRSRGSTNYSNSHYNLWNVGWTSTSRASNPNPLPAPRPPPHLECSFCACLRRTRHFIASLHLVDVTIQDASYCIPASAYRPALIDKDQHQQNLVPANVSIVIVTNGISSIAQSTQNCRHRPSAPPNPPGPSRSTPPSFGLRTILYTRGRPHPNRPSPETSPPCPPPCHASSPASSDRSTTPLKWASPPPPTAAAPRPPPARPPPSPRAPSAPPSRPAASGASSTCTASTLATRACTTRAWATSAGTQPTRRTRPCAAATRGVRF
jgi:hypothetical protein